MKSSQSKNITHTRSIHTPFFQKESNNNFFGKGDKPAPFFTSNPIQTKLTIGQPNDVYEKEADTMADKVLQRLSDSSVQTKPLTNNSITPFVQTKCSSCENEKELQKKEERDEKDLLTDKLRRKPIFESNARPPGDEKDIRRKCADCEKEEKLQKKPESSAQTGSSNIESSLNPSGQSDLPMPPGTRKPMENYLDTGNEKNIIQKQPIGGTALATTPAAQSSPLPANIVQQWQAQIRAPNLLMAANIVVGEMIRRGEIDNTLYRVQQTTTGAALCQAPNPQLIIIDNNVNGANTQQCHCVNINSSKYANPRVSIHPDLVQYTTLGSTTPQTNASVLHSTLLHEFRHVRQQYEECNTPGVVTSSGLCTDCNNPEEMDAYLAEIEAGYNRTSIMNAWTRVFVNWDYLSPAQQNLFSPRKRSAETKVNTLFPGVTWNSNQRVLAYRQFCQSIQGGPVGTCNSFMTPAIQSNPTQTGSSSPS